jgi:hypothetical protein
MTRGDLPGFNVLGRPFKPVALGLALNMLIVAQANFRDMDRGTTPPMSTMLGVMAVIAVTALILGWVLRLQRLAEIGLLVTVFVYATRAVFIQFTGTWDQAVFFSLAGVIIAGGSYCLEAADRQRLELCARRGTGE